DSLIENAELVADTVTNGWHFDRRERIHVTRRKPPKSPVAQAGLLLLCENLIKFVAKFVQCLTRHFGDPEIEQIVREMRAGQKLRRQICDPSRVRSAVGLQAIDRALKQPIAHSQGKRDVEIVFRRNAFQPAKPEAEIVAEFLLDFTGGETRADVGR